MYTGGENNGKLKSTETTDHVVVLLNPVNRKSSETTVSDRVCSSYVKRNDETKWKNRSRDATRVYPRERRGGRRGGDKKKKKKRKARIITKDSSPLSALIASRPWRWRDPNSSLLLLLLHHHLLLLLRLLVVVFVFFGQLFVAPLRGFVSDNNNSNSNSNNTRRRRSSFCAEDWVPPNGTVPEGLYL